MYCTHCGKIISEGEKYCTFCGKAVYLNTDGFSQNDGRHDEKLPEKREASPNEDSVIERAEVWFDSAQEAVQKKLGISDSRPMTHRYQRLGGWLALITYICLLAGIVGSLEVIVETIVIFSRNLFSSGLSGLVSMPVQFVFVAITGLQTYMALRLFMMIQKRDPRFLRFYEVMTLFSMGVSFIVSIAVSVYYQSTYGTYAGSLMTPSVTALIPSVLLGGLFFALILQYFGKSVRVRTYFRTDAYLRKSVFLKNYPSPKPAVPDSAL